MSDTTTKAPAPAVETAAPEAAPRRAWRPPRQWLAEQSRVELAVWAGLIALALALRLYDLGARPFHHDESQDAFFSHSFSKDPGSYEYSPLLHGPLRFYLTGLNYLLFGDSNFTARLAPALMGTLAVALLFGLRHQLGRLAALGAGVMLAIGPTYLYFSRFAREDIYLAAITLAIFVTCLRFVRRPRTLTLCLLGALISLSFATKESGLVSVSFVGLYFLGAIAVQGLLARRRGGRFSDGEVARAVTAVGWPAWVYGLSTLLIVYGAMFTVFFTHYNCTTTAYAGHPAHPTACINAVYYGLEYWSAQQDVGRGDDKAWLYLAISFGEEWPVMLLAAVGVVFAFLRPSVPRLFLVWMLVTTAAFYSWGSERFAWLVLHPLLPLILLAGVGLQCLWELRSRIARTAAMVAVAIGAAYMVAASYSANAQQPNDPNSLLVSTQSAIQAKQVADQVLALDRAARAAGQPRLSVSVDSSSSATFPYAWYFRDLSADYPNMTEPGYAPSAQVLIMTQEARARLLPSLAAYQGRPFDFRIWWIKDYSKKLSPGAWWTWLTERRAWNPTGGLKEWLYVRSDAGSLPRARTKSQIPALGGS